MSTEKEIPKQLGKYEIEKVLGQGAMGIVYLGYDPIIQRKVAIKTVLKDAIEGPNMAEMMERFKREATSAGRLMHPNIVNVYEYGEDGDTAYIAMEFIQGREFKEMLDNNERFELKDIVRIISELLNGLELSHKNNVIHRDIKPANIFIMSDNSVKITDFGIARIESSNLTQVGTVMGTPSYMSPEQFMGQRVDGRSDLFSVGVILYQLLTGEKPFTGSVTSIMHKVINTVPEPPSVLNMQLPAHFDSVVAKGMAKKLHDRYADAGIFRRELEAAFDAFEKGLPPPGAQQEESVDATMVGSVAQEATVMGTISSAAMAQPQPQHQQPVAPIQAPQTAQPQVQQAVPPQAQPSAGGSKTGLYVGLSLLVVALVGGGVGWQMMQNTPLEGAQVRVEPASPKPVESPPVAETPTSIFGFIDVNTSPAGAVVMSDTGEFFGVTPITLELEAGSYQLVIKKEGYETLSFGAESEPGERVPLDVELEPLQ